MLERVDAHEVEAFVAERTAELTLRDDTRILIRPIMPADKADLADGFGRLSEGSRYRRFMTSMGRLDDRALTYLTEIDYHDHFAWVAFDFSSPVPRGIGVARYVRLPAEPQIAEAAVTVVDDHHRRGLGRLLLESLIPVALDNGITTFRGYLLVDNHPMAELLRSLGATLTVDEPGVWRMDLALPAVDKELTGTPLYEALRAVAHHDAPLGHRIARDQGKGEAGPRAG